MIKEVAFREIRTRARTKAFRIITAILVLAAIAGPVIAAVWPSDDDDRREVTIGLVNTPAEVQEQIGQFGQELLNITFEDLSDTSVDDRDQMLSDGDVDVVLEPGPQLAWDEEPDFEIASVMLAVLQQVNAVETARDAGLTDGQIGELLTPVEVGERFADEADDTENLRRGVAFAGLMAAFILPQAFGQLTLLSVVEEKSSRVIEVLLSHLRPRQLLLGKVIGIGILGLVQMVVIVTGLAVALVLTNAIEIPASVWRFVPIILISVIGGMAIYNTFFALLGSLISRQEDASQVMLPLFVPLMAGYIVGQQAVFGNAESGLIKFMSYFPLTSPMILPIRVARDAIEGWEVALSLALMALGAWLLLKIASRVYEFTLLHTGARVGWGDFLTLARGGSLD